MLVTLVVLFRIEDAYGDRIIFNRLRAAGDRFLAAGKASQGAVAHSGGVSYVRITWHYFIHTLLRKVQNLLRRVQSHVDHSIQKNKTAARELQGSGDSHLSQIAAHKEKVALSEEERERRMSH